MARSVPSQRLQQLIEVATQTFIAQGYRQAQMDDVARALGVAKGTLYRYVESKEALFDAALRYADGHEPLPDAALLPLKTPARGATVKRLQDRIASEASDLVLARSVTEARCDDVQAELDRVVRDLYRLAYRNRFGIKLVDRCSIDYPELAAVWFGKGRWAQHELLVAYLQRRIGAGLLRRVASVPIAARMLLETVAFWAVHRHWDPSPQPIPDEMAEDAVVELLVRSVT